MNADECRCGEGRLKSSSIDELIRDSWGRAIKVLADVVEEEHILLEIDSNSLQGAGANCRRKLLAAFGA